MFDIFENIEQILWLEVLGPENLTIWVKFYVESEFQVENTRFLHPDPEN